MAQNEQHSTKHSKETLESEGTDTAVAFYDSRSGNGAGTCIFSTPKPTSWARARSLYTGLISGDWRHLLTAINPTRSSTSPV